ncbi:hypothetical protein niasHT_025340 [Heterodera trifolii]|uniref:Uncharacterized protein n=1 Tax=Heterodera trifolii TaxID=157864 RepID=A0ABD2KKR0_9BILA
MPPSPAAAAVLLLLAQSGRQILWRNSTESVCLGPCHCWPSPTQKGQQQIQVALGKGGDGGGGEEEGGVQMSNGPACSTAIAAAACVGPKRERAGGGGADRPRMNSKVGGHLLLQQCCADDVVVVVLVMMMRWGSEVKRNFCKFTRNPKECAGSAEEAAATAAGVQQFAKRRMDRNFEGSKGKVQQTKEEKANTLAFGGLKMKEGNAESGDQAKEMPIIRDRRKGHSFHYSLLTDEFVLLSSPRTLIWSGGGPKGIGRGGRGGGGKRGKDGLIIEWENGGEWTGSCDKGKPKLEMDGLEMKLGLEEERKRNKEERDVGGRTKKRDGGG